nr:TRAP transporter small permease [Oleiphilus messinensis]
MADVVARSWLNTAISWGHEVSEYLLLCLFFASIPWCHHRQDLLKVDLIYTRSNTAMQCALALLSETSVLLLAIIIAWQGWLATEEMREYEDTANSIDMPLWPFSALTCICGMQLLLQAILRLIDAFRDCSKQPTQSGKPGDTEKVRVHNE